MENMPKIFMCFSGLDRSAAQAMTFYLQNYGLSVWYDYQQLTMGDNGDRKTIEAIGASKYAIIIITDSTFERSGVIFELEEIGKQYLTHNITVIPLLYNTSSSIIPKRYEWMKNLIYAKWPSNKSSEDVALQLAYRIYSDIVSTMRLHSLYSETLSATLQHYPILLNMIEFYLSIGRDNINARLATLCSISIYLCSNTVNLSDCKGIQPALTCLNRLKEYTKLNVTINNKEIELAEVCVLIMLNESISSDCNSF